MVLYDAKSPHKTTGLMNSNTRFFSIQKNFGKIVNRIYEDDDLIKLLVRTKKDVKSDLSPVTEEERSNAIKNSIRTVPVNRKDTDLSNFIFIGVQNIVPLGAGNAVTYGIVIDIAINTDCWMLDDDSMRHIEILARLDHLLNDTKMDSFGQVGFVGATALKINEELSGITAIYSVGELS